MFGSRNRCSVDELRDLAVDYTATKEALEQLLNSSQQMPPREFHESLKRLSQELRAKAKALEECVRSLQQPSKDAEEFIKRFQL